jgi:hypothetical protein
MWQNFVGMLFAAYLFCRVGQIFRASGAAQQKTKSVYLGATLLYFMIFFFFFSSSLDLSYGDILFPLLTFCLFLKSTSIAKVHQLYVRDTITSILDVVHF